MWFEVPLTQSGANDDSEVMPNSHIMLHHRRRWVLPTVRYWEQYPQQQYWAAFRLLHVRFLTLCSVKPISRQQAGIGKSGRSDAQRGAAELNLASAWGQTNSIIFNYVQFCCPWNGRVMKNARSVNSNTCSRSSPGKDDKGTRYSRQYQHSARDMRATCDDATRFEQNKHTCKSRTLHCM